jgi:16S rRNA (cytosine967-C5)-methyltransferase
MRGDDRRRGAPTRTRLLALRVLERVQRASAFADIALNHALSRSGLSASDRAFATELVYGTLRWRGRIDYLLEQCLDRDLEKLEPLVATALRLGAYQIVFTDGVPANAAVDESVRCVRAAGVERATGLVNAVLRRLATEHTRIPLPKLDADPIDHLVHELSLPRWIAERWLAIFGPAEASAFARASNEAPPLTVRVNRQHKSVAELLADVSERFPEAVPCRLARDGVQLGRRGNPGLDPGFLRGDFTVQDEASQLVVGLLDPAAGERVLDVCAAPGGKATAIAERVGGDGRVLALDRHARRLGLVSRSARRLGLDNIDCADRDATRPLADLATTPFDRVLVDAPCSGLGTLRRHPDARWRIQPGDPDKLAVIQAALLRSAAAVVKPGGTLVYSTCTVLPEENEWIIEAFLKNTPGFELTAPAELPSEVRSVIGSDGAMRCLPHRHDADGFYAARLERTS